MLWKKNGKMHEEILRKFLGKNRGENFGRMYEEIVGKITDVMI